MAYVGFRECGYDYISDGNYVIFSDDSEHKHLFNYLTHDLSSLPALFDQHILQRMNTSTFELNDRSSDGTAIASMERVLTPAHPYYKYEAKKTIAEAIGNYFNQLLVYSSIIRKEIDINVPQKWYMDRIGALLSPKLYYGDTFHEDFYHKYRKWIGADAYLDENSPYERDGFICNVPEIEPTGFSDEIESQRKICNMLYFVLDLSAQDLNELKIQQRIWLFSNLINRSEVNVSRHLSLQPSTLFRAGLDYSQESALKRKAQDMFSSLYRINGLNAAYDGIPDDMNKDLRSVIEYAKTITPGSLYTKYKIDNLSQLLYLEILSMIENKQMIRRCRCCNKYFVINNRKTFYCDRKNEDGKRCSEIGSRKTFNKKMESDELLKIYTRAYKTHHARVRSGRMTQTDFCSWHDTAKTKLSEARSGNLSLSDFQKWLKE